LISKQKMKIPNVVLEIGDNAKERREREGNVAANQ
jgi:hypothetical protein